MARCTARAVPVLALALALALLAAAPRGATAALSCSNVYQDLASCLSYLSGTGRPAATCCSGVRSLLAAAKTTADRQTVCGCLRNAASAAPGPYIARAAALPGSCGVSIPYKISPSTDCSKIK